jgi:succinyl-CoA synthetase beta subunit
LDFKVFKQEQFFNLGLSGNAFKEMVKFIDALYKAYIGSDASMFEINSFKTSDDKILAVDAKVNIDDNALYRQKHAEMRDILEESIEVEAKK